MQFWSSGGVILNWVCRGNENAICGNRKIVLNFAKSEYISGVEWLSVCVCVCLRLMYRVENKRNTIYLWKVGKISEKRKKKIDSNQTHNGFVQEKQQLQWKGKSMKLSFFYGAHIKWQFSELRKYFVFLSVSRFSSISLSFYNIESFQREWKYTIEAK